MAEAWVQQTNFTGGELAPNSLGRFDQEKYYNGGSRIQNFLVRSTGALQYRSGFTSLDHTKDDLPGVCLSFQVDEVSSYLLVFTDLVLRVYDQDGVFVQELASPYAHTHLDNVRSAQSFDVLYLVHPDIAPQELRRLSPTSFEFIPFAFEVTPFFSQSVTPDGVSLRPHSVIDRRRLTSSETTGLVNAVTNSYVEYSVNGVRTLGRVQLFETTQSVVVEPYDDLVFVLPQEVYVTSIGSGVVNFSNSGVVTQDMVGKYLRFNYAGEVKWFLVSWASGDEGQSASGTLVDVVETTGSITPHVRTISALLDASSPAFDADDGAIQFRLHYDEEVVVARTTEFISSTQVRVSLNRGMPSDKDPVTTDWRYGSFFDGNWPSIIGFYQQRLFLAATTDEPTTFWMSRTGVFNDFSTLDRTSQVLDTSAINYRIDTADYSRLLWVSVGRLIQLGSNNQIHRVMSDNVSSPVTPRNVQAIPESSFGSSNVRPVRVGPGLVYAQQDRNTVRELVYNFEIDAHVSAELNILSNHVLRTLGGVVSIAFLDTPEPRVVFITASGDMAVLTYIREQEIAAFSTIRHGSPGARFLSATVIDTANGRRLMVLVSHTNGFVTVERMEPPLELGGEQMFLDSARAVSGSSGTVFRSDLLANRTVYAVLDGEIQKPVTLGSTGAYTLPRDVVSGWLGFAYAGVFNSLPLEIPGNRGSVRFGTRARVKNLVVRVDNALGLRYGHPNREPYEASFRSSLDPTNQVPPLFSGDIHLSGAWSEFSDKPVYQLAQEEPLPLTLLAVAVQLEIS